VVAFVFHELYNTAGKAKLNKKTLTGNNKVSGLSRNL
jgi:hypothetical protein